MISPSLCVSLSVTVSFKHTQQKPIKQSEVEDKQKDLECGKRNVTGYPQRTLGKTGRNRATENIVAGNSFTREVETKAFPENQSSGLLPCPALPCRGGGGEKGFQALSQEQSSLHFDHLKP